jgi:trehalose synthase
MRNIQKYLYIFCINALLLEIFGCSKSIQSATTERSSLSESQEYVVWLEKQSMLYNAEKISEGISGQGVQWRRPYAEPQTKELVSKASVWVLGYAGSMITRPNESVLQLWGDEALWKAFSEIGVQLLHTGPVKKAGGIVNYTHTPTIDGWFDRISYDIDPNLGTEEQYKRMVKTAAQYNAIIAGDLIPLHTGKGADYLLAIRNYKDYAGIYTMVEIRKEDWPLLPDVNDIWTSVPVSKEVMAILKEKGYVPGYINSNDAVSNASVLSGWDATGQIDCIDGKVRRWVYLHYFKPGQPTLNWLDPSFNGPEVIGADAANTIYDLGAKVVRLDAVPFLGIAPVEDSPMAWHYLQPLSPLATDYLAFLIRKLGGWSFQELNMSYKDIKAFTKEGPDLSYDFFTRTESLHALLTGDASLLHLAYNQMLDAGVNPMSLVHDLQNHDEITYQLVQLDAEGDKKFSYHGRMTSAKEIRNRVLDEMREKANGENAPYNKLYRPAKDGVATTFAGFISAALGFRDPYNLTAVQIGQIRDGHILLAAYNAMQPGVFSFSGWDLVGALPLKTHQVEYLLADNDYRWLNRGAVDLMGYNPQAQESSWGLPRAKALYGSLPQQLEDSNSFAFRLKHILQARRNYKVEISKVLAVPDVSNSGVFLLVMKLPENQQVAVSAINFSRSSVEEKFDLTKIKNLDSSLLTGHKAKDVINGKIEAVISEDGSFSIKLGGFEAKLLVVE